MDNPELAEIVRVLPADTAYQTVRTAAKLDFDVSDVLTVVANAVTLGARSPKGQEPALRDTRERTRPALRPEASRLAGPASRFLRCLRPQAPSARAQGLAGDRRPTRPRRSTRPPGSRRGRHDRNPAAGGPDDPCPGGVAVIGSGVSRPPLVFLRA